MPSASDSSSKAVISVSEMAGKVGLSRSHFHALVRAGVFPSPIHDLRTKRPMFTRELQEQCLRVKATQIGMDGQYRLFYSPRTAVTSPAIRSRSRPTTATEGVHGRLIEGLRSLGLDGVSEGQAADAIRACYPQGHVNIHEGEVLRTLWQHLRRREAV